MREKGLGIEWNQLVGVATDDGWSQVRWQARLCTNLPTGKAGLRRGKLVKRNDASFGLVVVVSLEASVSQGNLVEKGREIMESVVESFEVQEEEIGLEWVKREVSAISLELGDSGEGLVGLVVEEGREKRGFYVGGTGGARVELLRGGKQAKVWGGGGAVSGWLEEGDEVILGTGVFFEKVWDEKKEMVEAMAKVGELEKSAGVAGIVLEVGEVENESGEEIVVEYPPSHKSLEGQDPLRSHKPAYQQDKASEERGDVVLPVVAENKGKLWDKLKRRWGWGGLRLKNEKIGKRSWGLVMGLVFLGVFVASVVIGTRKRSVAKEQREFWEISEPIEFALEEAESLKEANAVRARGLVLEAREGVESQGDRFDEGLMAGEWLLLVERVNEVWQIVSGERMVEGDKWLSVGIFKEGLSIDGLDVFEEELLVLGKQERVVVVVSLKDKSGGVVAGGEVLETVEGVAGGVTGVLVLGDEKISVVGRDEKAVIDSVDLEGVRGSLIEGYGRSAYVVADEDVFKFPGTDTVLGKRRRFLLAGVEIDTSGVVDMAIDGDLWLLENSGRVRRLSQGLITDYEVKNVEEWERPVRVMASEELDRVWVWDKKLGAVIEFGHEDGEYLQKLVWDGFKDAIDVEIDESNERLMVARGGELWVVGLGLQ